MTDAIVLFNGANSQPIALKVDTIEAVIGEEAGGCTVVTAHDTHRVICPFGEALDAIWPGCERTVR